MVVVMLYVFVEYVGDGFEIVVWMFWEIGDVVFGVVGVEFIEQQEWIEVGQCWVIDDVGQVYVGIVGGGYVVDGLQYVDWFGKVYGDFCWMDVIEDGCCMVIC